MIFFLIGPERWQYEVRRNLTDRVIDVNGKPNGALIAEEQLRGINEHVHLLICSGGYELTIKDGRSIGMVNYHNAMVDKRLQE